MTQAPQAQGAAASTLASAVQSVLRERTTVHDYSDAPLPEGALERALEAALAAPNHRLTEPWRFVRLGPEAREALAGISADLKGRKRGSPLDAAASKELLAGYLRPPELLAVVEVLSADPAVERENYAAVACAIQNLGLSLWAEGVGSKWSTGGVTSEPATYTQLGLDPAAVRIVGLLWIGRAAVPVNKPRRRRSVSDVLSSVP